MDSDDLISLDWLLEIVVGTNVVRRTASQIASLPKGAQFSVSGTIDTSGYLYVLQIHDSDFAVLHPADDQPDYEEDGSQLTLPSEGARFTAPMDGAVRVFLAYGPVSEDEWSDLLAGREPKPDKATGKDG